MKRESISFAVALALVRVGRPQANPNAGFKMSLQLLEQAGGDIPKARELYKDSIKKSGSKSISELLVELRGRANELHAEVDGIENEIADVGKILLAANNTHCTPAMMMRKAELSQSLNAVVAEVVKYEDNDLDGPAKVIRKSAMKKALSLLEGLNGASNP
jgi:hypothetical protein